MSFGEVVVDVFPDREVVAGSPLHVSAHLAACGWTVYLVTRVGVDEDGDRALGLMRACSIETSHVERDTRLPTGCVTIALEETTHTFTIRGPAAWDELEGPEMLPLHQAFVYGSLVGRSRTSSSTLERLLRQSGAMRAFDVNLRPPDVHPEVLDTGLRAATLVKLSEQEFHDMAGHLGFRALPEQYFEHGPRLAHVCVTHGAGGAVLYARGGESWSVPGRKVEVVDTVGAGDAFTAGLVDGLVRGLEGSAALAEAADLATSVLLHRGGLAQ